MIERTAEEWAEEAVRIWRENEVATFTGTIATIVRKAMTAAYVKGRREAAALIEAHSCVSSCCDAQPSASEAKALANCVRRALIVKEPGGRCDYCGNPVPHVSDEQFAKCVAKASRESASCGSWEEEKEE